MVSRLADHRAMRLALHHGQSFVRLRDPETGDFLHLDGKSRTKRADWSWLGSRAQADNLRRKTRGSGLDWPFVAVPRDFHDIKPSAEVEE